MSSKTDNPGVIAPPPLIFLGGLAAGYITNSFWTWPVDLGAAQTWIGIGMIAVGLGFSGWSVIEFTRHGTHPDPRHPTTAIVKSGPFRWSRNPIYVAFTLMHLGISLWAANAWMLVAVIPALALIRYGVIAREERYLMDKFGEEYETYRRVVRRWL